MQLSIVIPTCNRPAKLAACLRRIAGQALATEEFEVLVGLDGPDEASARAAHGAWGACAARLDVVACPRRGYNATRNALLPRARGRILLSLNDDVLPEPGFLRSHLEAHREAEHAGRRAIVSGYSPFTRFDRESAFDVLARDTSMLFFYDQMIGANGRPTDHDWGFRHCWGLNFSAPLDAVRELGGFVAVPMLYGYDDIEMAWRLQRRFSMPVLFRPEARADHDHRYTPRDVLDRERRLGEAAWRFAEINPGFARDVFRRDIRGAAEAEYSREFVARERSAAERLERSFQSLADIPADAVAGPHAGSLINLLYEQHLLLKRWYWRTGLLEASQATGSGQLGTPAAGRALPAGVYART